MDKNITTLNDALYAYPFDGALVGAVPFGKGHINDTFAAYFQLESGDCVRFILQRINSAVFKKPEQVMQNIKGVTDHLKKKINMYGGNPEREALSLLNTKDGDYFFTDSEGQIWRCYTFIEDAYCFQTIEKPEHFYSSAVAFGNFQKLLSDYDAKSLYDTIPMFHNTKNRLLQLEEAIAKDAKGRAKDVASEITFFMERKDDCAVLVDLLEQGKLPLRVTHNDTKLNNVMIDKTTGEGVCVIDLDTVMPGLSLYDFGDSIRFGASTAAEDETDLSKVNFSLPLYEVFVKGFLEAAGKSLTELEISYLPWGAKLMTMECGMRFLTDYLNGDVYFKIHREEHNLDRARTQIKLVSEMEKHFEEMSSIVRKYV